MQIKVVGETIDSPRTVCFEMIQGEALKQQFSIRDRLTGAGRDITGWRPNIEVEAYTADGATVDALENFQLMDPQPADTSGVTVAIETAASGSLVLTVPKSILLSQTIRVNQTDQVPVLAGYMYLNNDAGRIRAVRLLFLYRHGVPPSGQ